MWQYGVPLCPSDPGTTVIDFDALNDEQLEEAFKGPFGVLKVLSIFN